MSDYDRANINNDDVLDVIISAIIVHQNILLKSAKMTDNNTNELTDRIRLFIDD